MYATSLPMIGSRVAFVLLAAVAAVPAVDVTNAMVPLGTGNSYTCEKILLHRDRLYMMNGDQSVDAPALYYDLTSGVFASSGTIKTEKPYGLVIKQGDLLWYGEDTTDTNGSALFTLRHDGWRRYEINSGAHQQAQWIFNGAIFSADYHASFPGVSISRDAGATWASRRLVGQNGFKSSADGAPMYGALVGNFFEYRGNLFATSVSTVIDVTLANGTKKSTSTAENFLMRYTGDSAKPWELVYDNLAQMGFPGRPSVYQPISNTTAPGFAKWQAFKGYLYLDWYGVLNRYSAQAVVSQHDSVLQFDRPVNPVTVGNHLTDNGSTVPAWGNGNTFSCIVRHGVGYFVTAAAGQRIIKRSTDGLNWSTLCTINTASGSPRASLATQVLSLEVVGDDLYLAGADRSLYRIPGTALGGNKPSGAFNAAPVASNDDYTWTAGTLDRNDALQALLLNDRDTDEDAFYASLVSGPTKGTLNLRYNGTFQYTPIAGATGDDTFTYRVNDGRSDSNIATVTIHLGGIPATGTTKVWNFTTDTEGWGNPLHINGLGWQTGGYVGGNIAGSDSQFYSSSNLNIGIVGYPYVVVRMKNSTVGTVAQIFFTTTTSTTFDAAKSGSATIVPNSDFTEYVFDMRAISGWTGTLGQLRLDPVDTINSGSFTVDSIAIRATAPGVVLAPAAPSALLASVSSGAQVNLTWVDNASTETGFQLERKTGTAGSWSQIAAPALNATNFLDGMVAANQTYFYRVRATNAAGNSPFSTEASVATPGSGGSTVAKQWTFTADAEGWGSPLAITGLGWQNGGYVGGTIAGSDSQFYSGTNLNIGLAGYPYVKMRLKNSTVDTVAQIFFTTNASTTFDAAKSGSATIVPNSDFTEYVFDMRSVSGWTGTLRQLRVDPVDAISTGSFSVDSITITSVNSSAPIGPPGYIYAANEHQSFALPGTADLAYGANGTYSYRTNLSGTVTFNNSVFGDPLPGIAKFGFYRLVTGALPALWTNRTFGAAPVVGSSSFSNDVYTVRGSGGDIWGTSDSFHGVYQPITGNVQITARVSALQNTHEWAKAGVMIRGSLDNNSVHALTAVTPSNGLSLYRRTTVGGTTQHTPGPLPASAPHWVRLERRGALFSSYQSADGLSWHLVGTVSISMPAATYVVLSVAALDSTRLCTALFDNVTVIPLGSG